MMQEFGGFLGIVGGGAVVLAVPVVAPLLAGGLVLTAFVLPWGFA
jgi:hypothetical protein